MPKMRLDKLLSHLNCGSRKEVQSFIRAGRVAVNGTAERDPAAKVDPDADRVSLDGREQTYRAQRYYMLNKPMGVITASRDERHDTVLELFPAELRRGLFAVGRLDKDTEGLLLITNDGALAHRLLSPVKHVPKTYLVHTKKPVTSQMCEKLEAGVEIGDETPTAPAKTKLLSDTDCGLLLTITEGRFHQVKRMLQAVGNEVVYLKRLSMGALVLDETLSKGSWRALTEEEKAQLGV